MTSTNDSLQVSRRIPAGRARVFEAWTRRDLMGWFCPEDMTVVSSETDVRVGGSYRAAMQGVEGLIYTAYGTYQEIVPDQRLVFTHRWEGEREPETWVTVEFVDEHDGTMVTLTQTGFADPEETRGHEKGWTSTLANLAKQFATSAKTHTVQRNAAR